MIDQAITTKEEESKELTKSDVFKPTPAMRIWLDTAIQLETDSITEIAEACKITRQSWYEWLNKPEFIEWFNNSWNERIKGHAWKLDVIGMKQGKRDFNYWKAMQQRVGNLKENSTNITGDKVIAILGDITTK